MMNADKQEDLILVFESAIYELKNLGESVWVEMFEETLSHDSLDYKRGFIRAAYHSLSNLRDSSPELDDALTCARFEF